MVILTAIVHDLFIEALKRVGALSVTKAIRLHRVALALKGHAVVNKTVIAALADFEAIINLQYGGLSDDLVTFFRELQNSGLATQLVEECIVQDLSGSTVSRFKTLYHTVFGAASANQDDELLSSIKLAFRASLDSLVQDPGLAIVIEAIGKNIDLRLSEIEKKIEVSLEGSPFINYDHLSSFLQKITKSLQAKYRYIRVETNKGSRLVDLDRIYIPSRLVPRDMSPSGDGIPGIARRTSFRDDASNSSFYLEQDISIGFTDFRTYFRRAIVLGDPGGGKSTLCQYLCFKMAKDYGHSYQLPEVSQTETDVKSVRIPVRIILRNYETARFRDPQLGLFDYIARDIKALGSATEAEVEYALTFALTLGKVVLAFDGLDEILNTAMRREFVEIVTSFCDEYPLCPTIVTSRLVGYEDASLPSSFEEHLLAKFQHTEVRAYLKKFLRVIGSLKADEADRDATKFMGQTSGNAADLRQNPLMLGLMAFIFANKGDVPSNRPEIYQECATLMFEKWDQNRNIRAEIPAGFDLLHLFSEIASRIYGNAELEEGVSKGWLETVNRGYFSGQFESSAKSFEAAKQVTSFLTGRSWVLSDVGSDVYSFTHRTFLEYFFARNLNEEFETVDELLSEILPKVVAKQWDVISHLALQMKTFRHPRRTNQAVAVLTDRLNNQTADVDARITLAIFAAGTLQYLLVPENELRPLLEILLKISLVAASANQFAIAGSVLRPLSTAIMARREYITSVVADLLSRTIQSSKSDGEIGFACATASWNTRSSEMFYADVSSPPMGLMVDSVLTNTRSTILSRCAQDPRYCWLAVDWFEQDLAKMIRRHGLSALLGDLRPNELLPAKIDPALKVLFIGQQPWGKRGVVLTEGALNALRAVGACENLERLDTLTPTHSFSIMVMNVGLWMRWFAEVKSDFAATRGLLICFIVHTRLGGISRSMMTSRGGGRSQPNHMAKFSKLIESFVASVSPEERALFRSWLEDPGSQLVAEETMFDEAEPL